jgi:aspartate kinase
VSYEEMLEMAATGARVLQLRAVEYARASSIMLHVRSSFSDEGGTWVKEEDERMEQAIISGVTHDGSEAKVTVEDVPDRPGVAAAIFRAFADEAINVDMIVQNVSRDGKTDVSFTVGKEDLPRTRQVADKVTGEVGAARWTADDGVAKVSLVGAGMKTQPGVQADMFSALADEGINIEMISTSSIRITCVIRAEDVERAVRALHSRFSLADEAVVREH